MVVSLETSKRRQIIGLIPASTRRNWKIAVDRGSWAIPRSYRTGPWNRMFSLTYQIAGKYLHQAKLAQKESRDEFETVTLLKEL